MSEPTKTFVAKVRYADVREITVEADAYEEAMAKYQAGDFDDEYTVEFYSDAEVISLREKAAGIPVLEIGE